MIPLGVLSLLTVAIALNQAMFWTVLLLRGKRYSRKILAEARHDLSSARQLANACPRRPIVRFLLAALNLSDPSPESVRLALEDAGMQEFLRMSQGNRFLETVIASAPLLGLLGTVTGLINTFFALNLQSDSATQAANAAAGIGEALITTAAGMVLALIALGFFQLFVGLQAAQVAYFSNVGNQLELIYRQHRDHSWTNETDLPLSSGVYETAVSS